jgi:hypothetical protein
MKNEEGDIMKYLEEFLGFQLDRWNHDHPK